MLQKWLKTSAKRLVLDGRENTYFAAAGMKVESGAYFGTQLTNYLTNNELSKLSNNVQANELTNIYIIREC